MNEERDIMKNYTYDIINILNDIYLDIINITIFIIISPSWNIEYLSIIFTSILIFKYIYKMFHL